MTETPDAIDDMIKKGPKTLNAFNKNIVDEFRANDGKVGGQFANANLLLLTTTGAKSGQRGVSPLAYFAACTEVSNPHEQSRVAGMRGRPTSQRGARPCRPCCIRINDDHTPVPLMRSRLPMRAYVQPRRLSSRMIRSRCLWALLRENRTWTAAPPPLTQAA